MNHISFSSNRVNQVAAIRERTQLSPTHTRFLCRLHFCCTFFFCLLHVSFFLFLGLCCYLSCLHRPQVRNKLHFRQTVSQFTSYYIEYFYFVVVVILYVCACVFCFVWFPFLIPTYFDDSLLSLTRSLSLFPSLSLSICLSLSLYT